jgi:perosamine synthetase
VGKGSEVILPTHVCTALLNAINYLGAKPVLVDVDYEDGNISVLDARRKLTRKTKAILVPHMGGEPADLSPLLKLGVPVVEDCAQAVGARYAGKPVGTFGTINIFSFYATKMMTTGEGGMVVSNDRKLMARVRDHLSYDHKLDYRVRFNYKMTDIAAAMGTAQLKKLDGFVRRRRVLAGIYHDALAGSSATLPQAGKVAEPVYYRFVVKVPSAETIIRKAKARGINCEAPLFRPLHVYLGKKGFPVSDRLMKECVSIPLYPSLTDREAHRIASEMRILFDKKTQGH